MVQHAQAHRGPQVLLHTLAPGGLRRRLARRERRPADERVADELPQQRDAAVERRRLVSGGAPARDVLEALDRLPPRAPLCLRHVGHERVGQVGAATAEQHLAVGSELDVGGVRRHQLIVQLEAHVALRVLPQLGHPRGRHGGGRLALSGTVAAAGGGGGGVARGVGPHLPHVGEVVGGGADEAPHLLPRHGRRSPARGGGERGVRRRPASIVRGEKRTHALRDRAEAAVVE
mmetsp:Transcript_6124/g.19340  ORF Transcript_6124/g.19340 Transcript_6124/m.19340 type:complete len:232 (+) Transcript_6124:351-1046(+)